jgi:hypothetical protein
MSFYSKFKDIDIYNMELHEQFEIEDKAFKGLITRVPGGWIYERDCVGYRICTSVFIPFDNEFMERLGCE